MLLAIQYGTVPGWIAAIGAALIAYMIYRGGGGGAMAILKTANEVLQDKNRELTAQAARDQTAINGLRASRDFAQAITPFVNQVREHEQAHLDALGSILLSLEAIARKLGVDERADTAEPERFTGPGSA